MFRSGVEPVSGGRKTRFVDENGIVGTTNTMDELTGVENAVRVTGHEVGGHVVGGLGTSRADEARSDEIGEQLLQEYREENEP